MMDSRIVAAHELGHVLMAYTLGRPIRLASIRPAPTYLGVACHTPGKLDPAEATPYLQRPAILWPHHIRSIIETEICISLAGPIAEELTGEYATGYVPTSPDELAAAEILEPRTAALLSELEVRTTSVETDDAAAAGLSHALADVSASQHLGFMRAEVRRVVCSATFRRQHELIMPVLLERGAVSGQQVLDIIEHPIAVAARTP